MNNTLFQNQEFSNSQIKAIRENANCSQSEFASMLNIKIGTLRNWEQGRRKPDGAAVSLLKIFSANPKETAEILSSYTNSITYTEEKKKEYIKSVIWDYEISDVDIFKIINGKQSNEKKKLFAKTFQYLHWQDVVRLWGLETCMQMYDPSVRKMILPSLRGKYDFIFGKILNPNIPNAGFGASDSSKLINSILSHRRNRT